MARPVAPAPSARELSEFVRPGRLRFKALVAVTMVVLAPLVAVWVGQLWDGVSVARLRWDLSTTAVQLSREVGRGRFDGRIAASMDLRVRVLAADGTLIEDEDGSRRAVAVAWEAEQPPLLAREEVVAALRDGAGTVCQAGVDTSLIVCAQARTTPSPAGETRIVHVQGALLRPGRVLYADRYQILQLTGSVLLFAILLTLWLGTRWVRPLESLRDQALDRVQGGLSTEPLQLDREDELGEVASAFNTLLSALDERNRGNELFAADLAHELKNPLAAVRTAAEALQPGKPLTPERAVRLQRILADSSQRMEAVIERFLELARAEAGLADAERTPVDLVALAGVLAEVSPQITVEGPSSLVVRAMPERLETVLRNLFSNAVSFAGPDGTVRVVIRSEEGSARLEVTDSGPGIAPADLPRVFDRYFSRRQGGTGLGLALSRAIAAAHGGSLEAQSPLGEGATFVLRLPR